MPLYCGYALETSSRALSVVEFVDGRVWAGLPFSQGTPRGDEEGNYSVIEAWNKFTNNSSRPAPQDSERGSSRTAQADGSNLPRPDDARTGRSYWEQSDILARLMHKWAETGLVFRDRPASHQPAVSRTCARFQLTFLFDKATNFSPKLEDSARLFTSWRGRNAARWLSSASYERMTPPGCSETDEAEIGWVSLHGDVLHEAWRLIARFGRIHCKVFFRPMPAESVEPAGGLGSL